MSSRIFLLPLLITLFTGCTSGSGKGDVKSDSPTSLADTASFNKLAKLIIHSVPADRLKDSMYFFIIPVDGGCSSCRDKSINALISHVANLDDQHCVIITAAGQKAIDVYMSKQNKALPLPSRNIVIDNRNLAFKSGLVFTQPTLYHAVKRKVIRKQEAVPVNIDDVLNEFFSVK